MTTVTDRVMGVSLAMLAGIHVVWGCGSSFPFRSRHELADAVIGTDEVPAGPACFAVATALATGAGLVLDRPHTPATFRRYGLLAMSSAFGARALLGWLGKTDVVSPGSDSARFRRLDARIYSPLCAALAVGSLSARRSERRPADRD